MSLDDDAERMEQLDRDLCLKRRKQELERTGKCHWCEDDTDGVYCSSERREDSIKYLRFNA